jgi:hypothetical protein
MKSAKNCKLNSERMSLYGMMAFVMLTQFSCSSKPSDLTFTLAQDNPNVVPATQFSCSDIRGNSSSSTTTPTASISADSISISDVVLTWHGSDTLYITTVLLYGYSPYMSGGGFSQSLSSSDVGYLLSTASQGTIVQAIAPHKDSNGTTTTVHTRFGISGSDTPCNFAWGGFSHIVGAPTTFTVPATAEFIGVATDSNNNQRTIDATGSLTLNYTIYGPQPTPAPAQ